MSGIERLILNLDRDIATAIGTFWETRDRQSDRQREAGVTDAGARGAVTGGAQMDGFISLIEQLVNAIGIESRYIFHDRCLELPGYYRPTKKWDLLIVVNGHLLAAIEAKSQVGPSFGNNFNNRTEEAMGSALDLWTAYREGAFNSEVRPWLGYAFLLEDARGSTRPVKVGEPHFRVFPEFVNASYKTRYEVFCRKLVRERQYDAAAFIMSSRNPRDYHEPARDLTFEVFVRSLLGHLIAFEQFAS